MKIRDVRVRMWLRFGILVALAVTVNLMVMGDAMAQRGRGGRGGGGMRGGGGYRPSPSYSRSPSMSRPAAPAVNRSAAVRTNPAATRPSPGNRAAGGTTIRNNTGNRAGQARPGSQVQGRPASRNQLNDFLDLSGGAAQGNRPRSNNAAINDFLSHNPSTQSNRGTAAQNRSDRISGRTDNRSGARDSRGENRDFASDNRQDRLQGRGDRQSGRVADRGEMRSDLASGRADRRTDRQTRRGEHADEIRNHLEDHYGHDHLFDDFWSNHPHAHYHFHQNPVFWTWATVGTVRAFMPWNWGAGGGGGGGSESYYEDGTVYADDQQIPAEEYAAQAEAIVTNPPEVENTEEMEWLPLGVFAVTQDDNPDAIPNMFLQLAVSKEGILAGTYQNKETDQTESVEGVVDPESKRAVWAVVGKTSPIMETNISSLTENETSVLVHFADGTTQQWMMLHVENPDLDSEQ